MKIIACLLICFSFSAFGMAENEIKGGVGKFLLSKNDQPNASELEVFYHVPVGVTKNSPVIMVVPGAGRNAWSYRDAWIEASNKYNLIVVSPHYSETKYPRFWQYNFMGMIDGIDYNKKAKKIDKFFVNKNQSEWRFNDFDRIFERVKKDLELSTTKYEMFGHSAGGQIIHRFALFYSSEYAGVMLASNSGWYTVTDFNAYFPFGLNGLDYSAGNLDLAFNKQLVLFLGEEDNANEKRGHLAKGPKLNIQGAHRLERGNYFFEQAKVAATGKSFNWLKVVVPGIGHDYKNMSIAAAEYLYGGE